MRKLCERMTRRSYPRGFWTPHSTSGICQAQTRLTKWYSLMVGSQGGLRSSRAATTSTPRLGRRSGIVRQRLQASHPPRLQPAIKRKDWPLARLCWTAQPGLLMQSWRFGRSSMPTSSSHLPPMHKVCNKAYWIPSALGEKTAHGTAWCSNMHGERGLCLINRPGQSLKVAIDRAASHWHEIRDIGLWIRFKHIS